MPTMMVGSAAIFIDCDESWKLFLVTRKGSLYVWDLFKRICLLHDSLSSLVALNPNPAANDAGTTLHLSFETWVISFVLRHTCIVSIMIRTLDVFNISILLSTLSRDDQSYISKAIKIWFAYCCSRHSPCLPL